MSSAYHISFLEDFEITNENFRKILFDRDTGLPVDSNFDITLGEAVTEAKLLPSRSIEHVLAGTCLGCTLRVVLEMSPDGKNWVTCKLKDGVTDCLIDCDPDVADCTVSMVDVSLLQYIRLKIGPAGSLSAPGDEKRCSVRVHYTLD